MSKPTVTIRTLAAAVALFIAVFISGSAQGQHSGYRDPAAIPSPTGMLYGGGTLEFLPNGQPRLSDYPTVSRVDSGSVSAVAGLKVGDVLLSVNGKDGREAQLFRREHGETRWIIRIRREGEEKELTMEVPSAMLSTSRSRPAPRR